MRAAALYFAVIFGACRGLMGADVPSALAAQIAALRNSAGDAARISAVKTLSQHASGIKPLAQALALALQDKNADVRSSAARALADIGPSARDAVAALARALNDRDEGVRARAAFALGEIGAPSQAVFCGLSFQLQDASAAVRASAADALGKFGEPAQHTCHLLCELLRDVSSDVAQNAAVALARLGEAPPEAARFLPFALGDSERRKVAELALRELGATGVAALDETLKNSTLEVYPRRDAAALLGRLGGVALPAVPALEEALGDPDKELQNRAAQSLVELNAAPAEAALPLLRVMRESNADFRAKAHAAFESMKPAAVDTILAALQTRDDAYLRREAARVLAKLAPRFKDNPKALIDNLVDPDESVRFYLVDALANSGADAAKIIAPLIQAMQDTSDETSAKAGRALCALPQLKDDPKAIVALAEARMRTKNFTLRDAAGKAVLAAGAKAIVALPVLRAALGEKDEYLRGWALEALENIGPAAAEAIPDAAQCLVSFASFKAESARALGAMGEKSIPVLLELMLAGNAAARPHAANGLARIGAPALPKLLEVLRGEDAAAAALAAQALETMAPASAPAAPELIAAARSKADALRSAAIDALARIGVPAMPALLEELKKEDDVSRRIAVLAMGKMSAKAAPLLIDTLRSEQNPDIQCALLEAIGKQGAKAAAAAPFILEVLGRTDVTKERGKLRGHCAYALGAIGAAREAVVPVLFEILASEDRAAHVDAYSALLKLGGEKHRIPPLKGALRNAPTSYVGVILKKFGQSGLAALFTELQDPDPLIRDRAALAFVPLAADCIPFLLKQAEESPANKLAVALALGEIRAYEIERRTAPSQTPATVKVFEEWRKALDACAPFLQGLVQSPNANEALVAMWALGKPVASGSEGVAAVIKPLVACAPDLQIRGIRALKVCELAKRSREIVPALGLLLKMSADVSVPIAVRKEAAGVLSSAGYCAESVPALISAIQADLPGTRTAATAALQSLGAEARSAIPQLIGMLERANANGYASANVVLAAIGDESISPLIQTLKSENLKQREGALNALYSFKAAKLAPRAREIAALLKDEREEVCVAALQLIRMLEKDGRSAEPQVRALLGRNSDTLFSDAADTVLRVGGDIIAALAPHAESENDEVALRALAKLRALSSENSKAMHQIAKKCFKSKSATVRTAAITLLGRNATTASEEFPLALLAMKDPSYLVRSRGAVWLYDHAKLDPGAALPTLVAGLADSYSKVSSPSSKALVALGERAAPAIPLIKKLLDNPSRSIQINAATALFKMGVTDEPRATLLYNESHVYDNVTEYFNKQDQYMETHWNDELVHYYALTYLETWGAAAKEYAAQVDPDGVFNLGGYKLKVLHGQGLAAPGGKKSWLVNGLLTQRHALIAWPSAPGVTGTIAYLVGPDGTIYQRAMKPEDAAKIPEMIVEFNPVAEWEAIVKPVKLAPNVPHEYFKPKGSPSEALEF